MILVVLTRSQEAAGVGLLWEWGQAGGAPRAGCALTTRYSPRGQVGGLLTRSIGSPRQGKRSTKSESTQRVPPGAGGKALDRRLETRPPATSGQDPARKQGRGKAEDLHAYSTAQAQAQARPGAQAGSKMEPLGPQAKGARLGSRVPIRIPS